VVCVRLNLGYGSAPLHGRRWLDIVVVIIIIRNNRSSRFEVDCINATICVTLTGRLRKFERNCCCTAAGWPRRVCPESIVTTLKDLVLRTQ